MLLLQVTSLGILSDSTVGDWKKDIVPFLLVYFIRTEFGSFKKYVYLKTPVKVIRIAPAEEKGVHFTGNGGQ